MLKERQLSRVSFTDIHKSVFWHGLMQRAFVANATFILGFFFDTTKRTPFAQLSMTGVVFVISGSMHVIGRKLTVPTMNEGNLFWFYCLNGLGIIFEDVVQILYSHTVGNVVKSSVSRRLGHVVGYVWTFLFISWTIPKMYAVNS
jgi:hypothetical protein